MHLNAFFRQKIINMQKKTFLRHMPKKKKLKTISQERAKSGDWWKYVSALGSENKKHTTWNIKSWNTMLKIMFMGCKFGIEYSLSIMSM